MNVIVDLVNNPTVIAIVTTFTVIYTATLGPELPKYIQDLFQNEYFKFIVIFAVAYLASARRPVIALVSAISFLFIMQLVSEHKTVERFTAQPKPRREH